jgi:hypothetical protein
MDKIKQKPKTEKCQHHVIVNDEQVGVCSKCGKK